MILVVGSTGYLGSEICRRLVAAGKPVRGLVRPTSAPEKVENLRAMGVQTVLGDLRDPASLSSACQGIEAVITTASCTISRQPGDSIAATDQQGQVDLVKAARAAGVKHFIYISVPQIPERCPLTDAKRTVEEAIQSSGMMYTILRSSVIMEIWLSPFLGFDYPHAKANILGDGHAKNYFISLGDLAQYAVDSLSIPAARNAIFEIGCSQPLSLLEVVRIFEKTGGKPFDLQFVPEAALVAQRAAATDPLQFSLASLMLNAAHGLKLDPSLAARVFSFPLTGIEDYAQRVLAVFPA